MRITLESIASITALDIRDEATSALESGDEQFLEHHRENDVEYVHFPAAGRGAVCAGGDSEWTDCHDMEDLIERWRLYDKRWCN